MNKEQLIDAITPDAYERLLFAVETGKWPEGAVLTQEQRDYCMQAIMLYQSKHNVEADHMSVDQKGEMVLKTMAELKRRFSVGEDDIFRVNPNVE